MDPESRKLVNYQLIIKSHCNFLQQLQILEVKENQEAGADRKAWIPRNKMTPV